MGSESGVGIPADMAHHGVTEAGQLALGNGLAELARGTGVRVNTIVGANRTSLLERFIEPEEIAHLTVFIASPLSSATDGAAVRADGGVLTAVH